MSDDLRDGDHLEATIARIQARLDTVLAFADEKTHSAAATLTLVRMMLVQANAVAQLSATPHAEAATTNARAMFEAWLEIYALLEPGFEEDNARRCIVFGLLEFRDHGRSTGRLDDADIEQLDSLLAPYRRELPTLVADIEALRLGKDKRNRNYWMGTSRTAILKRMEDRGVGAALRSVYKILSWDAHHVIAVALRSSIQKNTQGSLEVGFHTLQQPAEIAAVNRFLATRMLVKAWWQVSQHLAIDPG